MSDVENDPQYKGWKRIYEVNPDAAEMHPKHKEFIKAMHVWLTKK